jgi:isopentenyl phosphate kinase
MAYTFIKLGGSVITAKTGREAADLPAIRRLAADLAAARAARPDLPIILGHGSGSFGHHYAAQYGVHRGIAPAADHFGYALTAAAALRLNRIVVDALLDAGVPALSLQPIRSAPHWHGDSSRSSTAMSPSTTPRVPGSSPPKRCSPTSPSLLICAPVGSSLSAKMPSTLPTRATIRTPSGCR